MPLPITRLRLHLEAQDPIHLPEYPGSALRGIFGHGLRRTACVTRQTDCTGCLLHHHCAYAYLFETPFPPDKKITGLNGNNAPHPIVFDFLNTASHSQPGETLTFDLSLVGQGASYLPYIIQAWRHAAQRGLGKENARFRLAAIDREETPGDNRWKRYFTPPDQRIESLEPRPPQTAPFSAEPLTVAFTSPFRTKIRGKLIGPREFEPDHWLRPLIKRIEHLRLFHAPATEPPLNIPALLAAANTLRISDKQLHWRDWTRHSSRQRSQMQMGGLSGTFTLHGDHLKTLWPILWAGQWLHVGKGISFGLGGYRLTQNA